MKKGLLFGTSALGSFGLAMQALAGSPNLGAQINGNLDYGTLTGLGTRDIREVIMTVINVIFGFLAAVFLVILLLGVFQVMTSGGGDGAEAGKKHMIAAIVGLAIMFVSYAIALFVVRSLVNVAT